MWYICTCGEESEITLRNFLRGQRCSECAQKKRETSNRRTLEEAQKVFSDGGGKLLATEYVNTTKSMPYICSCGNQSSITLGHFQQGHRCKKCGTEKGSGKQRCTLEHAQQFFLDNGCTLLATEYKNSQTKMPYLCSCGNKAEIRLNDFKRGYRCRKCGLKRAGEKTKGENHWTWNPDRESVKLKRTIINRYRKLFRHFFNKMKNSDSRKTAEILGYTRQDFVDHITNHPNWPNVKNDKWHVDHIFPVVAFLDIGIFDPKIVNALDNIQPLSAKDNLLKQDHYDYDAFIDYLNKNNIQIPKVKIEINKITGPITLKCQ
jgi:hypothetical protein